MTPIHPGTFVRNRFVALGIIFVVGRARDRELSISAVAEKLGVTRPAISRVLNAHAAMSPTMALLLEEHYGFDADNLVVMQARYDLAKARAKIITIRT